MSIPTEIDIRMTQDAAARERAKQKAYDNKISETMFVNEKLSSAKHEKLIQETLQVKQDIQEQKQRVAQLESMLEDLSNFANQKTSLMRRMEIVETELAVKSRELREQEARHVQQLSYELGRLREQHLIDLQNTRERAKKQAEQNIAIDVQLLTLQNQELLRARALLMSAAANQEPEEELLQINTSQLERKLGQNAFKIIQMKKELKTAVETFETQKTQCKEFAVNLNRNFEVEKKRYQKIILELQKLIYIKCKELYKTRTLSAAILQKRTDLEKELYTLNNNFEQSNYNSEPENMNQLLYSQTIGVKTQRRETQNAIETVKRWIEKIEAQVIE
ncbi:Conserved_hypothetical protein [Hexamita inflata]|uniref:Uncharacterized protein n=1 Tax=Hexamita inflata TaxID=28002 RepID=A0AA86UJ08_9EUKA|nr:Conserved hypothetical protein [Hexamita inflata]